MMETHAKVHRTTKISSELDKEMRKYIEKRHGSLNALLTEAIENFKGKVGKENYRLVFTTHLRHAAARRQQTGVAQLSYELPEPVYEQIKLDAKSFGSDVTVMSFVEALLCAHLEEKAVGFHLSQ